MFEGHHADRLRMLLGDVNQASGRLDMRIFQIRIDNLVLMWFDAVCIKQHEDPRRYQIF